MALTTTPQKTTLYTHASHPHAPRNAAWRAIQERTVRAKRNRIAAINERLAVWLTTHTGTMAAAYVFAGIGIGSLVGVFTGNAFLAALFGSISSYFLQLVLLPILSVGQNVLSRHAEIQSDEQFHATLRILHENAELMRHLNAQDAELLKQTALLSQLSQLAGATAAPSGPLTPLTPPASPAPTAPDAPRQGRARTPRRKTA